MQADPYGSEVRRLFAAPEHAGTLDAAVVVFEQAQGVRVELSALSQAGQLETLRYRAWGCPHLLAAAEAFCESYEGRSISDLESFSGAPISKKLDIPVEKTGRILVLEDAIRSLWTALASPNRPAG